MAKLILQVSCDVEIIEGDSLSWDSNNKDAFASEFVHLQSDVLKIKQKSQGGGTTVIQSGGSTIIQSGSGRNISIGDVSGATIIGGSRGGVWINGRRVDVPEDDSPFPEDPYLTVSVPVGCDVEIKSSGSSNIHGDARLGKLTLSSSGSTDISLTCHTANLSTSGSTDIELYLTGGKVSSKFSGSTNFNLV